jgi:hypothetical protein
MDNIRPAISSIRLTTVNFLTPCCAITFPKGTDMEMIIIKNANDIQFSMSMFRPNSIEISGNITDTILFTKVAVNWIKAAIMIIYLSSIFLFISEPHSIKRIFKSKNSLIIIWY